MKDYFIQARDKAVKAGYDYAYIEAQDDYPAYRAKVLLDKNFWVALGKGLGNKDIMRCKGYNVRANEPNERGCNSDLCEYAGYKDPRKMYDNFMGGNWEGRSPESYFKELLKDENRS